MSPSRARLRHGPKRLVPMTEQPGIRPTAQARLENSGRAVYLQPAGLADITLRPPFEELHRATCRLGQMRKSSSCRIRARNAVAGLP